MKATSGESLIHLFHTELRRVLTRHFFGALAEDYFDSKLKEASVNVLRKRMTFEGFANLPQEFTTGDVMRCFHLNSEGAARMKIKRLTDDNLIRKDREVKDGKVYRSIFCKTGTLML